MPHHASPVQVSAGPRAGLPGARLSPRRRSQRQATSFPTPPQGWGVLDRVRQVRQVVLRQGGQHDAAESRGDEDVGVSFLLQAALSSRCDTRPPRGPTAAAPAPEMGAARPGRPLHVAMCRPLGTQRSCCRARRNRRQCDRGCRACSCLWLSVERMPGPERPACANPTHPPPTLSPYWCWSELA